MNVIDGKQPGNPDRMANAKLRKAASRAAFRSFALPMLEIELSGETVSLMPERALWWERTKTLMIADVHWGKSGHFRKHGIAIPAKTQERDELRLAALVRDSGAERLVIAGDLFHSRHNNEVETFGYWRKEHASLHIDFVLGNHDILADENYAKWNLTVHREQLDIAPFCIAHDDTISCDGFLIHGHIHPGIRMYGGGRQSISLPCFCEDSKRLILPAFGRFTGCHYLNAAEHKHLYAVGDTEVIKVK